MNYTLDRKWNVVNVRDGLLVIVDDNGEPICAMMTPNIISDRILAGYIIGLQMANLGEAKNVI